MPLALRRFEKHISNAFINYKGCVSYRGEGPTNPDGVQLQHAVNNAPSLHLNNAVRPELFPELTIYVRKHEKEEAHAESIRAHLAENGFDTVKKGEIQGRVFHVRPGNGAGAREQWRSLLTALGRSLDRIKPSQEY